MSVEEKNAIAVRIVEEFLNRNNPAVVDELFADDFVNHSPQFGVSPDREGLKQMVAVLHRAFPDVSFIMEDLIVGNDKIVVRMRTTGKHTGEFLGMQPTNKSIDLNSISILHLKKGKVKERWNIADQGEIMRQLGLM